MAISFSSSEIINLAIGIEQSGIAFYDVMARSTENALARDTFQYLADMERQHVEIFQGMLSEADKWQPAETYTAEYAAYLQALVGSAVFSDDMVTSEMAARAGSEIEAMELAIVAEKDSILFYYEMRDIVPRRAQSVISKVLSEEKAHLEQLSALKKKLAAG